MNPLLADIKELVLALVLALALAQPIVEVIHLFSIYPHKAYSNRP